MTCYLRVGDLVFYGCGPLGVFLGETHILCFGVRDTYNHFYHSGTGRVSTTIPVYGLLSRLALPDDPRSTPARGDPR